MPRTTHSMTKKKLGTWRIDRQLVEQISRHAAFGRRRKFKKNAPDWYEEIHEQRRKAHSSRRIRVEHGIAHLKNWRALARHHGRREHMSDTIQAVAALLSHQQSVTLAADERV